MERGRERRGRSRAERRGGVRAQGARRGRGGRGEEGRVGRTGGRAERGCVEGRAGEARVRRGVRSGFERGEWEEWGEDAGWDALRIGTSPRSSAAGRGPEPGCVTLAGIGSTLRLVLPPRYRHGRASVGARRAHRSGDVAGARMPWAYRTGGGEEMGRQGGGEIRRWSLVASVVLSLSLSHVSISLFPLFSSPSLVPSLSFLFSLRCSFFVDAAVPS